MDKKKKNVLTIIIAVAVIVLVTVVIMLVLLLPKKTEETHTEHVYKYEEVDATNHKKTCTGCSEIDELEPHEYTNDEDEECNLCGYERHIHSFEYTPIDSVNHKKTCAGCSEIDETLPHNFDKDSTFCSDCGYVKFSYTAASGARITVDKSELNAGDTFTVKLELETKRDDLFWEAIDVVIGPMDSNNQVSSELAKNFEMVENKFPDNFNRRNGWVNNSSDQFSSVNGTGGFRISLSYVGDRGKPVPSSEKFVFSITLKVKETATNIDSLTFGITETSNNLVQFATENYDAVMDFADGTSQNSAGKQEDLAGLTVNSINLKIKSKSN